MAIVSAKNAKVRFGATTICAKVWTVDVKVDALDVTCTESAGLGQYVPGIKDADITVEFDYNVGAGPFTAFPVGNTTAVTLYIDDTGGPSWAFSSCLIVENNTKAEVRSTVQCTIKLKSSGTITPPAT